MKIILFIITLIAINSNAHCQTKDCSQFKKGTFTYTDSLNQTIIVKRHKRKQEEINQVTGERTFMNIKWTAACEYELEGIWRSNNGERKSQNGVTKVIITSIAPDGSYQYSSACSCDTLNTRSVKGIMKKIN